MESGYEVVGEAGDGIELLALLQEMTPDMIILDISMPRLRGNEVISRIKATCRSPLGEEFMGGIW